jgi:hypothetical protein
MLTQLGRSFIATIKPEVLFRLNGTTGPTEKIVVKEANLDKPGTVRLQGLTHAGKPADVSPDLLILEGGDSERDELKAELKSKLMSKKASNETQGNHRVSMANS